MLNRQQNPAHFPIQLLVNYWEIQPNRLGAKLDQLLASGVKRLVSFVPWQSVESDISHMLPRLILAVAERKMTISLIVTPELGIHFASSGLPKDLMNHPDSPAAHFQKGPIPITMAPNSFLLPSIFSAEFTKRYYSFLTRIDTILADLEKSQSKPMDHVTLILSGSFWKNYRSPAGGVSDSALGSGGNKGAFSGIAGDYSKNVSLSYRQRVDEFYSQPEFNEVATGGVKHWKTLAMEPVNRRWFYQQSEAMFRSRILQLARKKAAGVQLSEVELFTPEADTSLSYSFFLNAISGCQADFGRLSSLLDEAGVISGVGGQGAAQSWVHWTAFGSFRSLTVPEKQFLILKSLLLLGAQGGGLLIDEEEWFSLSKGFRKRAQGLARSMQKGEIKLKTEAAYLCPHLWSGPYAFWRDLSKKAGFAIKKAASLDGVIQDPSVRLLIIDPSVVLGRESVRKLLEWAGGGQRILVLPRGPSMTEMARMQLESSVAGSRALDVNLGVRYQLIPHGPRAVGKLVIYEAPEASLSQEMNAPEWQTFLDSVLSLSEILPVCQPSDSRVSLIPLERPDQSMALFVLNATRKAVQAEVIFPLEVCVSDFSLDAEIHTESSLSTRPAKRFALEVPPCGVMPLLVDRVGGMLFHSEQAMADALSGLDRAGNDEFAMTGNELPGFGSETSLWN